MQSVNFELPHIRLAGLSWGDENKPKIIALHGWLDNAASFIPLAQYIEGYHLIAIDWPGHGLSAHRPVGANYQLLDYVFDLYALIKHQGWQRVHLVAHSLGGIVASIFTATFPELVDKLVLIESLGPISATPEQTRDNIRKSAISQQKLLGRTKPVHLSVESAVMARKNASDFSLEIANILVQRAIKPYKNGFSWRSDIRLRSHSPWRMTETQAQDIVGGIKSETLLIVASSGLKMVSEGIRQRRDLIEQLMVLEFAGGHHVHMEQPLPISQAIQSHFDG